jgi:mannose-6-phosphate isomerase-like protein (cupin superfamily)
MHPDTREWWVIQSGQIRFPIDGQEPSVAKKGLPRPGSLQNALQDGNRRHRTLSPLRSQHRQSHIPIPLRRKAARRPRLRVPENRRRRPGRYEGGNRPFIDFANVVNGTESQRRFIADDRAVSNIIFGDVAKLPPARDADKGHFHPACAEFWIVRRGTIE